MHDADILEQLGAIGALRAVAKVGRDTRYPMFFSVLPVLQNAVDSLPGRLRTENARVLAATQVEMLLSLIACVQEEAVRKLF